MWNCYRDEPNDFPAKDYNTNPVTNSKFFKNKTIITGKISNANQENSEKTEQKNAKITKNLEIVVPFKYLSNFWRTVDIPIINYETFLTLTWSEKWALTDIIKQAANSNADLAIPAINAPKNATFQIKDTRLYVPVVTLSTEHDKEFLEQLKTGFKKTIKWNKYRSEMTNQAKTNNLNYLIDPTFNKVNRLSVLSFQNEEDSTSKKRRRSIRINYCKNNDYTTDDLLDYEYFRKHYKLITIIVTRNNIVWKLARGCCLCYCKIFSERQTPQTAHQLLLPKSAVHNLCHLKSK